MLAEVYDRADEFDIVHSHVDVWSLPVRPPPATPSVLTMHGRLDVDHVQAILPLYPDVPLVSISDSQRAPLSALDLRWAGTVYNGLDLRRYHDADRTPGDHPRSWAGSSPEKGPEAAIEILMDVRMPKQTGIEACWPSRSRCRPAASSC